MENRSSGTPYEANDRPQKRSTTEDSLYMCPQGFVGDESWSVYDMKPVNDDEITSEDKLSKAINHCLCRSSVRRAFRAGCKKELLDAVWYCMYHAKEVDKREQTITHFVVKVDKTGKVSREKMTMPLGNCPNCFTVGCLGAQCKVCTNNGRVISRIRFIECETELSDALGPASIVKSILKTDGGSGEIVLAQHAAIPTFDKSVVDKACRKTPQVVQLEYSSSLAKKVNYDQYYDSGLDPETCCRDIAEKAGVPYAVAKKAHYRHFSWDEEEGSSRDELNRKGKVEQKSDSEKSSPS